MHVDNAWKYGPRCPGLHAAYNGEENEFGLFELLVRNHWGICGNFIVLGIVACNYLP